MLKDYKIANYSFGVVCAIFIFCPLLSLPWIINGCYNNKKKYYLLASFFMGICGLILYLPINDQYRYATEFYNLKGQPWITYYILGAANGKIDFIVNGLMYLANSLNLPFGFIRAFLTSICSYLFLLLYDYSCNCQNNISNKQRKLFLWLIFLLFPITNICGGLRYPTGVCFAIYVFVKRDIFDKKIWTDYLLLILSILTHTGIIIAIALYFISFIMPTKLAKSNYVIILITCLVLSSSFYLIIQYLPLPSELAEYAQKYTEGKFANPEYLTSGLNIVGLIQIFLMFYGNITAVIIPILIRYKYIPHTKFLYLLLLFYALTLNMFSLNSRVGIFITIFGGFAIICFWKSKIKTVMACLLSVAIILQVIGWRKFNYLKYEYFLMPIVYLSGADHDEKWIEDNVNEEGTIKDYW